MAITRRDSRGRIGIVWFDNEPEAAKFALDLLNDEGQAGAVFNANLGIAQCGRDPAFDRHGPDGCEYAVVTP